MATIQITDGTTTLNLYDSASYAIVNRSWSPSVAVLARDVLGGDPYVPVIETMQLRVKGTTTANCLSNLHTLSALINQADRWYRGENVDPVVFVYQPTGSTLGTAARAAILGAPPDTAAIETSGNVELINTNNYQLFPVTLSFIRRGAWLGAEESDSSSASNNPAVLTATNTASDIPSPLDLELTNFTSVPWGGSYLLVTDDADKLDVYDVTAMTATGFAATSDSSKNPLQGTNILRYTPADTDWNYSGEKDIAALLLGDTRDIAIYMNARRNAAGTTAQVKVKIRPVTGGYNTLAAVETAPIQIEYPDVATYADTYPQYYYAGTLHLPIDISDGSNMYLSFAVKTNNTSSTVDFDAMALMDVRNTNSRTVYFPASDAYGLTNTLYIDHQLLTKPGPRAYISSTLGLNVPHEGDRIFTGVAAEAAALWLATGLSTSPASDHWAAVGKTTGLKLSNALTSVRREAYLVPQ